LQLSYRPPFDWDALIGFLSARATPGVEAADRAGYRRTIAIDGQTGAIVIAPADTGSALRIEVRFADSNVLPAIVERARRMFDLDADPSAIAECLGGDRLLTRPLAAHPGIRTPGAWDAFELTVRAIVGQQISVRGATTIAGRIAARWGTPIDGGLDLNRLFPTPDQLADAPLEEAGITRARAATIRAVAKAVADGRLTFEGASPLQGLRGIPGIGDWTAQYVAMRGLNEPDAFLSGDLVLRRMAGGLSARELEERSAPWRPWRAYAVMLLWQSAVPASAAAGRYGEASPKLANDGGTSAGGDSQQLRDSVRSRQSSVLRTRKPPLENHRSRLKTGD
jgi:AraC family transcriptional regulator of adaptative response / DNA-3-methyladenine glycosylase II